MLPPPPRSTLFPYTTLFRSVDAQILQSGGPATASRVLPHLAPIARPRPDRSEEHTSELQSRRDLVCRLLLEKKKKDDIDYECTHRLRFDTTGHRPLPLRRAV